MSETSAAPVVSTDLESQIAEADIELELVADEDEASASAAVDSVDVQTHLDAAIEAAQERSKHRIPIEVNRMVQSWIDYFTVKDRERFHRFLKRGNYYREVVQDILEENGVPIDLYYLAMIESGYATHAKSHAKAVGTWQFMRATGKRYGLHTDIYVDERMDPIRATEAAARYLRDLHQMFGSWHLAMAAYNAGEGRIGRAIRRGRTKDFWSLAQRGYLPRETMHYVPKFFAAVIIGRDPARFGFTDLESEGAFPAVEAVSVPSPVKVADVAEKSEIGMEHLLKLNPHLHHGLTPPGKRRYEIWLPAKNASLLRKESDQLIALKVRDTQARVVASVDPDRLVTHRVRPGETMSSIARRYRISVRYLKKLNHLKSNRVAHGQNLRVVAHEYKPKSRTTYRVRPGDSLTRIAKKFRVSIVHIKRVNNLRRNSVFVGERLEI